MVIGKPSLCAPVVLSITGFFPLLALFIDLQAIYYSPDFGAESLLFLNRYGFLFYVVLLTLLVLALTQLEKSLRLLPREERWRAKYEMLGACLLLAALIFYYSQGLLYRSLNMALMPVRTLMLAVGVGLIGYSRLARGEARNIIVSRQMVFRSVAMLAVGCYLLFLGIFGEGLRYFGESFRQSLLAILLFSGALVVLAFFLSDRLKRKFGVFLHKNFYRQKYDYRSEWQQFTRSLSGAGSSEGLKLSILRSMCKTFALQGGLLFLKEEAGGRFVCRAEYEMQASELALSEDDPLVCLMAERPDWVINLAEKSPSIQDDYRRELQNQGVFLILPLVFGESPEGLILLGAQLNSGERLTYEDFDLMRMLARQATSTLLSMKLSAQLSSAQEMAAMGRVSTFVIHDLKNLASNLAMVTENAVDYLDDPDFQRDMLVTLNGTVDSMKGLITRLKNVARPTALKLAATDLYQLAEQGVRLSGSHQVAVTGESVYARVDAGEMQKVLQNLLLNAREASGSEGPITLVVGQSEEAYLKVSDRGCGMSEEFIRERLFQPFQTTKEKGFGIGLYQCKNIVEAHGGRIEVQSRMGEGTTFTVVLPGGRGR
ncbi:MAG: PEP-CTERM system histidine kinase PrsK [Syntrophotaleaceae bacterium]